MQQVRCTLKISFYGNKIHACEVEVPVTTGSEMRRMARQNGDRAESLQTSLQSSCISRLLIVEMRDEHTAAHTVGSM